MFNKIASGPSTSILQNAVRNLVNGMKQGDDKDDLIQDIMVIQGALDSVKTQIEKQASKPVKQVGRKKASDIPSQICDLVKSVSAESYFSVGDIHMEIDENLFYSVMDMLDRGPTMPVFKKYFRSFLPLLQNNTESCEGTYTVKFRTKDGGTCFCDMLQGKCRGNSEQAKEVCKLIDMYSGNMEDLLSEVRSML